MVAILFAQYLFGGDRVTDAHSEQWYVGDSIDDVFNKCFTGERIYEYAGKTFLDYMSAERRGTDKVEILYYQRSIYGYECLNNFFVELQKMQRFGISEELICEKEIKNKTIYVPRTFGISRDANISTDYLSEDDMTIGYHIFDATTDEKRIKEILRITNGVK